MPRLAVGNLCLVLALFWPEILCAQNPVGALSGRRITVSAGHGYYWHATLGWTTQRPVIDGLVEDRHTNEIVMDHLLPYLEGAGASVITCRARTRTLQEHRLDNDQGAPNYVESGVWASSASSGFGGTSYRYATTSPTGTASATYTTTITATDHYPVYLAWRAGTNRATDVEISVHHAGGTSLRRIDQTLDDRTWVYLGSFPFRAFSSATVVITNRATSGGVVIADAVRIGDGLGTIARGGNVSGRARWEECSRYHAQEFGAPSSVYDSISGGDDNSDDVTCRPRYAEWRGAGDAFLSLHTNAGGGSGTSTWIHDTAPTAGSATFRQILHARLLNDLRAGWSPSWVDDGQNSANFGELRLLSTMPGCLVELAYHDDLGGDLEALHHPRFRRLAGRALYRGLAEYLAPGVPLLLEPPAALALRNDGLGGLVLSFTAVPGATGYRVRTSGDGFAFDDGVAITGTSLLFGNIAVDELRFVTVAAINAGGTGPESERIGARRAPGDAAPLLLVNGFDRLDRYVKEHENRRDGLIVDGAALAAVVAAGYPFDGASNEAVSLGLVPLTPYRCVGWILGEESTIDETFSTLEQSLLTAYIGVGGNFFFTGAEVGWDLDFLGSASDRTFYRSILGHTFVADDAGVYATQAASSGPLAGLPALTFDNGSNGMYDVDWPDVVSVTPSTNGQIVLRYSNGLGAGVLHGNGRVLGLGFPLEAVVSPTLRRELLARILGALCPLPVQPAAAPTNGIWPIQIEFENAASGSYLLGAALTSNPGISLGDGRIVPLTADVLLAFSTSPGNGLFFGMAGTLDAQGRANASFAVPPDPSLSGLSFVVSGVAIQGTVLTSASPWARITLP